MKTYIAAIIIIITIGFCFVVNSIFRSIEHKIEMQAINELNTAIEKRTRLDSLYWDHLEGCSWINSDSVYVDSRGMLRVKLID